MNKKILTTLATAAVMLLAGCGNTTAHEPSATLPPTVVSPSPDSTLPDVIEPSETDAGGSTGRVDVEERLKGLEKNAYDGLEISAEILQRNAILPGMTVPVTVLIKNTGDKTVRYTHGSGSAQTPDALLVEVNGLQTVLPEDKLGPMTLDLQTKELKPGEELKFVANVMVIEPNDKFDEYTYEMHGKDKTYIGTIELPDLQKIYADIKAAATGEYDGKVYFTYSVVEATADPNATGEGILDLSGDKAYSEASFKITVTN